MFNKFYIGGETQNNKCEVHLNQPSTGFIQKPAEWSEEDKKMIERLIRHTQKEYDELCNEKASSHPPRSTLALVADRGI